jgi:HrpA-like RNA helicase
MLALEYHILLSFFKDMTVSRDEPKFDRDARQLCKKVLERLYVGASRGKEELEGAILIFLPGYYEIQLMYEDLAPLAEQYR